MARNKSLDEIIADAERIERTWEENPTFTLGDVTQAVFKSKLEGLRQQRAATDALRTQLTSAINEQDAKAVDVSGFTSRALSGMRAVFGPDSTQYEQAGGTRASERRSRKSSKKQPS